MKVVCVGYAGGVELKATSAGRKAWLGWVRDRGAATIAMEVMPPATVASLADFPSPSTLSVAFSSRASTVVAGTFEDSASIQIDGLPGYSLGWPRTMIDYFAMDGRDVKLPLQLAKGVAQLPSGFLEVGVGFTKLPGSLFVTEDMWSAIVASGLTGLTKLAEFEVLPP